jgi:hypothetical protein
LSNMERHRASWKNWRLNSTCPAPEFAVSTTVGNPTFWLPEEKTARPAASHDGE